MANGLLPSHSHARQHQDLNPDPRSESFSLPDEAVWEQLLHSQEWGSVSISKASAPTKETGSQHELSLPAPNLGSKPQGTHS